MRFPSQFEIVTNFFRLSSVFNQLFFEFYVYFRKFVLFLTKNAENSFRRLFFSTFFSFKSNGMWLFKNWISNKFELFFYRFWVNISNYEYWISISMSNCHEIQLNLKRSMSNSTKIESESVDKKNWWCPCPRSVIVVFEQLVSR